MKMTCPHCSERIEVVFEAGERAAPCPSCQGEIAANAETSVLEARNLPPRRRPPDVRRRGNSAQASSSLPILLVVGGLVGLVGLLGLLCVGGVFGLMLFRVEPAPPGPGPLAREQEVKAPEMMPERFVVRPGEPLPVPEEPKVVAGEPIAPPKEVVKIPPVEKDDLPPVPPDAKQPAALVRADAAKGPRDLFGNALPQGALARLGASMFHHGGERHEGVVDLQFSADGKWIASAGSALIRIWNAADGKEALTFKTQPRVTRLAFYPNRRGMPPQLLVSTGLDKTIRFWDLNTGAEMNKVINHPGIVSALTIAPDGKQLATASAADQHVYLWDMEDGKELRRWKPHNGGTAALAFSGDGKMLATGGAQNVPPGFNQPLPPPPKDPNTLAIWNLQTNERVQTFGNHTQDVYALVWSQNGKVFASAGADPQRGQSLIFWNADSGTRLDRGDGNFDLIPGRDFRLSADGKLLACGGPGGVAFWDTRAHAQQRGLENQGVFFKSLALSPDGATAATGDDHGDIVLWDVPRRARKFNLESHTQRLTGVAVSPDGKTIATSSDDGTARVWDRTGKSLRKIKFEQGRGGLMVRGLAFAPDGKSIALAHVWEGITIWDARDGQLKRHIQPNKRKGIGIRMNTLAFSPAGRYLAWAGMDAPAPGTTLWNLEKNQEERVFPPEGQSGLSVAISSDGQFIAAASGRATVWRLESGDKLFTAADNNTSVAFAPAGVALAAGNFRWVSLVETATGKSFARFDRTYQDHESHSVAVSPDGRLLAVPEGDDVRVWEIATKRMHTFKGHAGKVIAVAFSPDSKSLVSASADCTALVWDVSNVLVAEKAPAVAASWADLKAPDRLHAYGAFCRLLATPEETIPLLRAQIKAGGDTGPDGQRRLWAIKLLEHFGTPPAREVLDDLAKENANSTAAREAAASLKRLSERGKS